MKCPKCNVELKPGIAIDPKGTDPIDSFKHGQPTLTNNEVEIKSCLKCPVCGYSEDDGTHLFRPYYR